MNISIILLTYNSINYLDKFIESIYSQTFQNFELIIVDNYSTDGTVERINRLKLKNANLIQFKNFGNMAASRNIGIKNAKYEYLAFHDSDDYSHMYTVQSDPVESDEGSLIELALDP